jgi:hypothetical protein
MLRCRSCRSTGITQRYFLGGTDWPLLQWRHSQNAQSDSAGENALNFYSSGVKRQSKCDIIKGGVANVFGPFVNQAKRLLARSYRRLEAIPHNSTVNVHSRRFSEREEGIAPEIFESENL